jgi:hypothetical protein
MIENMRLPRPNRRPVREQTHRKEFAVNLLHLDRGKVVPGWCVTKGFPDQWCLPRASDQHP